MVIIIITRVPGSNQGNSLPIDLADGDEGSTVVRVATCNQEGGLAVGLLKQIRIRIIHITTH